ncbi:MAG: transcription antitermination factor NusB [Lachnospiraceae bacterium]|nr:transcription antitermination factor NusB [Lachnospiraceae bacterium]
MGRHEQREQLFKLLFRVEFNSPDDMPEQVKLFFQDDEIQYTDAVMEAIQSKFAEIQEKLGEIDEMLNEKAEGWNVARMGKVELTVLRIAVYEMLFDEEIPETVAINEAIEISKKYGQAASGSFVNAVLAKFVKKQEA